MLINNVNIGVKLYYVNKVHCITLIIHLFCNDLIFGFFHNKKAIIPLYGMMTFGFEKNLVLFYYQTLALSFGATYIESVSCILNAV
ncbi:hypothetical protein HNR74_004290 [Flammeovirga kamogawensis]|nr:hypothetical protein [Flammeovirga kamogawensis]